MLSHDVFFYPKKRDTKCFAKRQRESLSVGQVLLLFCERTKVLIVQNKQCFTTGESLKFSDFIQESVCLTNWTSPLVFIASRRRYCEENFPEPRTTQ